MTLPLPEGNWSDYNVDNTSATIHIPEVLDNCLESLAEKFELTKSDLARNALMLHVRGRYQFERLVDAKLWRPRRRQQIEDTRKFNKQNIGVHLSDTPRKAYIDAFGKSVVELKVWMPRPLRDQLGHLAYGSSLTTAEYMRRALTAYYLGRTVLDPLLNGEKED